MTPSPRRRTKILATLGPASDNALKMEELLRAGVDLFRINFSHGDHAEHAKRIAAAREAEKAVGRPIALIADLQGPKLRVGDLPDGKVDVRMSSELRLTAASKSDDPDVIPIPHPELVASLQLGDKLLIDDGKMILLVVKADGKDRIARPVAPGRIGSRKGVTAPNRPIPIPALTDKDIADGRLKRLYGEAADVGSPFCLHYRKDRKDDPGIRTFTAWLREDVSRISGACCSGN